jgi:hypothetical protein
VALIPCPQILQGESGRFDLRLKVQIPCQYLHHSQQQLIYRYHIFLVYKPTS